MSYDTLRGGNTGSVDTVDRSAPAPGVHSPSAAIDYNPAEETLRPREPPRVTNKFSTLQEHSGGIEMGDLCNSLDLAPEKLLPGLSGAQPFPVFTRLSLT